MTEPIRNTVLSWNPEPAGRIILAELCNGSVDEALRLMKATRDDLVADGKLTEHSSTLATLATLAVLTRWFVREDPFCEEALAYQIAQGGGYGRASTYLAKLPYELRAKANDEANIMTNMQGGRYADNVGAVVRRFLTGDLSTPLIDYNAAMVAKEKRGEIRPGQW